jgi:glycosyltransferase involved in cell wall biosynthesis
VRVIRNGHAVPPLTPLPSAAAVTLGCVAHLRREKGHLRLLRALAALKTTVPWRVDLAGDGPLETEVRREVARHGLGDRVRLLGRVADAPAFWRERDVAVLLSDHEGSPNALIEAALMGRPLVATAVGGVPELVDASLGRLVEPDDDHGTASALRELVEDRSLRERLGAAARERAIVRYSMDAFVDGHCAAIREALELAGA